MVWPRALKQRVMGSNLWIYLRSSIQNLSWAVLWRKTSRWKLHTLRSNLMMCIKFPYRPRENYSPNPSHCDRPMVSSGTFIGWIMISYQNKRGSYDIGEWARSQNLNALCWLCIKLFNLHRQARAIWLVAVLNIDYP